MMAWGQYYSAFLDTNGDGTGTVDAISDYSSTDGVFFAAPPEGFEYRLSRMIVSIRDDGIPDAGFYGNNITLTNGIQIRTANTDGVTNDLLGGQTIKTNAQWSNYCYNVQVLDFGTGDDTVVVRWTFSEAGTDIFITSNDGGKIEVILSDDFSALTGHRFLVQGQKRATLPALRRETS
jgi:hypothetical protein